MLRLPADSILSLEQGLAILFSLFSRYSWHFRRVCVTINNNNFNKLYAYYLSARECAISCNVRMYFNF